MKRRGGHGIKIATEKKTNDLWDDSCSPPTPAACTRGLRRMEQKPARVVLDMGEHPVHNQSAVYFPSVVFPTSISSRFSSIELPNSGGPSGRYRVVCRGRNSAGHHGVIARDERQSRPLQCIHSPRATRHDARDHSVTCEPRGVESARGLPLGINDASEGLGIESRCDDDVKSVSEDDLQERGGGRRDRVEMLGSRRRGEKDRSVPRCPAPPR